MDKPTKSARDQIVIAPTVCTGVSENHIRGSDISINEKRLKGASARCLAAKIANVLTGNRMLFGAERIVGWMAVVDQTSGLQLHR